MSLSGLSERPPETAHLDGRIDIELVDLLVRSKPWLHCVSVFMWIAVVLLLGNATYRGLGIGGGSEQEQIALVGRITLAALSLIYSVPAYRIWRIANTIGRLKYSRAAWELHAVLDDQRRFFTFMGASLILLVIGYALMVVVALLRARL